jgi:hypothetical protein
MHLNGKRSARSAYYYYLTTSIHVFLCLYMQQQSTFVAADLACGAGKILVEVAGSTQCVNCGDDDTLTQATGFQATCATNLGAIYCRATDANNNCVVCPMNSATVIAEPAAGTDCQCKENFYGAAGSVCTPCPAGTHSAQNTATANECVCDAGTWGSVVAGVPMCQPCPMGSYCPGDGSKHVCASNKRTEPGTGSTSPSNCKEVSDCYPHQRRVVSELTLAFL